MTHSERGETLFANLRKSQLIRVCSYCEPKPKFDATKFYTHGACAFHLQQQLTKAGLK